MQGSRRPYLLPYRLPARRALCAWLDVHVYTCACRAHFPPIPPLASAQLEGGLYITRVSRGHLARNGVRRLRRALAKQALARKQAKKSPRTGERVGGRRSLCDTGSPLVPLTLADVNARYSPATRRQVRPQLPPAWLPAHIYTEPVAGFGAHSSELSLTSHPGFSRANPVGRRRTSIGRLSATLAHLARRRLYFRLAAPPRERCGAGRAWLRLPPAPATCACHLRLPLVPA